MESRPLDTIRFGMDERRELNGSLDALGLPKKDHERILESLICIAEEQRTLIISASRAPRISQVRHDLQELAETLRDGTELLAAISVVAWNAILGRYPASTFDIVPFSEVQSAELPNQLPAEDYLALPIGIAASHDIVANALAQPRAHSFVRLHWNWHSQNAILKKLFKRIKTKNNKTDKPGRAKLPKHPGMPPTSKILTARLKDLTRKERAQLLVAVEWAASRVDETCVPKSRPNTGRRTTFQWANGFLDRILAANVISALWPEHIPVRLSSRTVAEIIDCIKLKPADSCDSIEITHVTRTLSLMRQRSAHEAEHCRLFSKMETLNRKNVELNRMLIALPQFKSRSRSLTVQKRKRQERRIKSSIRINTGEVNRIDVEYSALTASLREIKRRLRSGDYQPTSRARIPKITGTPLKIKTLDAG